MKTNIHFWSYLAHLFLEWELFWIKFVETFESHILCFNNFFLRNSCRLRKNAEKYGRAGQVTDDNIIRRMHFARWKTKATNTHTHRMRNTHCSSTAGMVARSPLIVTLYVHCMSCVSQVWLTFWRRNYFFFNFSTPVYKMWIIQEPHTLELWNKLHFEEKKLRVYTMFKIFREGLQKRGPNMAPSEEFIRDRVISVFR